MMAVGAWKVDEVLNLTAELDVLQWGHDRVSWKRDIEPAYLSTLEGLQWGHTPTAARL
jgi:hypothetical protein